ncbi:hypothetical protein Tco_0864869 [Tanacetum coccineum]
MIGCKVMRTLASVEFEIMSILGLSCCHSSSSVRCLENVEDPYEAIRQAYLVGTDTESEPIEAPKSPHPIASPTSLPDSTPTTCHVKESEGSDTSGARSMSSDSTTPHSPDHPLTHTTPTLVPVLDRTSRMAVCVPSMMSPGLSASMAEMAAMSNLTFRKRFRSSYESLDSYSVSEGAEDEGPTAEDEDPAGRGGQQRAAPVVETTVGEPLGLGYGALRRQEIALGEGWMPSVFEVGQSFGSLPESERPEIVSALRQPTLTTWMDPEDGIVYIDVPAYPPPAPPAQTSPSPEWSSGPLFVSPAPSIIPSPISSPMISLTVPSPVASPATAETEGFLTELGARVEMQGGLIHDHTVRLEELSPALFERYDRDIGELFTRFEAVRDEIFSQRYRFRSLEHEQEKVAVTFGAIWRPVLALESWTDQTDAQRAALWHAISDTQGENRELRL